VRVFLTRRELFELGVLALAASSRAAADDAAALREAEQRASAVIGGYSAEGLHRTATPVDRASADRLLALARDAGARPTLESFQLSRVDPVECFVEIGGRRIDGLPLFDGGFTGADGVAGTLGPIERDGSIAFVQTPPNGEQALHRLRVASRHRAIVAVTVGARPGLCPVNAGWFSEPLAAPVVQIAGEHLAAMQDAAAGGATVRVVSQANRTRASAENVVAAIEGSRRDLPPVCVMTPRSGWHANASERGGGLACWLEAMRTAAGTRHERTVLFVASSGHELGHLGLHDYLDRRRGLAATAFAWVHLGANIGASTGQTAMSVSDDGLNEAAGRALTPYGLGAIRRTGAAQVAGEAATIAEQHGRFVSFIGQNAWFHNPGDRWPDAVDVNAVARYARAIAELTVALANAEA
jgi:hypothetical protein